MNALQANKLSTDSERLADETNYTKVMAEIEEKCRDNRYALYTNIELRPATADRLEKEGYKVVENGRLTTIDWYEVEKPAEIAKEEPAPETAPAPAVVKRIHKKKPTKKPIKK